MKGYSVESGYMGYVDGRYMLFASDFRKGMTFEINGDPHVVVDFQHVNYMAE